MACHTDSESNLNLPSSLKGNLEPSEGAMLEVVTLTQTDSPAYIYQSREGESIGAKENQWTSIVLSSDGKYQVTEVYNLFEAENKEKEYFVLAYDLDPNDTLKRMEVRDYRFRTTADTAFYSDLTTRGARLAGEVGKGLLKIYGYEYLDTPAPVHIKYWHPKVGMVLMYSGGETYFELTKAPGLDSLMLADLRKVALINLLESPD